MNKNNAVATITTRLRPLRLAFLTPPEDINTLATSIVISTCTWGGKYNCFIPYFRRTPRWWVDAPFRAPSAQSILQGYIHAFEPDYIVSSQQTNPINPAITHKEIVQPTEVLFAGSDWHVAYGLSVNHIYNELYDREFKFARRHPVDFVIPFSTDPKFSLFIATCFGSFPEDEPLAYFRQNYKDAFSASDLEITPLNLFTTFEKFVTPLNVGASELRLNVSRSPREPVLFLLDATAPRDLIDFWNLRALGWRVLPVPIQWMESLIQPINDLLERGHKKPKRGHNTHTAATLLKSRTVSQSDAQVLLNRISTNGEHSIIYQHWYPRIWDSWARDKDQAERANAVADERISESTISEGKVSFQLLLPKIKGSISHAPQWANVIQFKSHSPSSNLALVIPPEVVELEGLLRAGYGDNVSSNSEGIVVLSSSTYYKDKLWHLPDGSELFSFWAKAKGFSAELSGAGRIAAQLIRSLGGLGMVGAIANPEIIKLLDKMSHGLVESTIKTNSESPRKSPARGRTASHRDWFSLLQRVSGNSEAATHRLEFLTKQGVLRIGLKLSCPECSQTNWYSLGDLADQVGCERCLRVYPFPAAKPPLADAWSYRTQGPFSIDNYAQGAYAVALALNFFSASIYGESTWTPNIELRLSQGSHIEVDFAVWKRRSVWSPHPVLILGECKSFGEAFTDKEIERAQKLTSTFPGAIIAFITLRKELSPQEKQRLSKLARTGRRSLGGETWRTPVLVLTEYELMGMRPPPECWENAGARFSEIAKRKRDVTYDLYDLCDATQQLHLDMEPYAEWHAEEMERRAQKRARAKSTAPLTKSEH